jgi:hypothetical protein
MNTTNAPIKSIENETIDRATENLPRLQAGTNDLANVCLMQAQELLNIGEDLALKVYETNQTLGRKQETAAVREQEIMMLVADKRVGDKPAYTNDQTRKAAAATMIAQDAVLGDLRRQIREGQFTVTRLKLRLERINGEVEIRKAYMRGGR